MNMAKILRDKEQMEKLTKIFSSVCRRTISDALDCKTNSDQAKRIRKVALDLGCQQKGKETIKHL
jgi:hypothetical protein